jgi:hypothetical protein
VISFLLESVGGIATLIVMAALGDLASEEVRDRLDHLPQALLRLAARRLDADQRLTVYEDEWMPELTFILKGDEARPITRLYHGVHFALGILAASRRVSRTLDRPETKRTARMVVDTNVFVQFLFSAIDELRELTAKTLPDGPETITHWRQKAVDCVTRAEACGQPVILALALDVAAQVELAADDIGAAMNLLRKEYDQVSGVAGKSAATQAVIALSLMAKIQLGTLKDYEAALKSAVTAIELIERTDTRVSAPFQQAALVAPRADLFTTGIFAAWKGADYDQMLKLIELAKATAPIRRLFIPPVSGASRLDQQLSEVSGKVHALDPKISAGDSDETQQRLRKEARQAQEALRRERLGLWDRRAIAKGEPDAPVPTVTLAGLQAALGPDEAVISYYWLHSLNLLITTVNADAIVVEGKILTQDQRKLLEHMIHVPGSLTGSNRSLDTPFIAPLATALTPIDGLPLLEGKQRLIVSPHRLLHWYPFAALPYRGEPLFRSFAIHCAPNLTSLPLPPVRPNGAGWRP